MPLRTLRRLLTLRLRLGLGESDCKRVPFNREGRQDGFAKNAKKLPKRELG